MQLKCGLSVGEKYFIGDWIWLDLIIVEVLEVPVFYYKVAIFMDAFLSLI